MPNKSILVVGGAGFIGSHANKILIDKGLDTIVLDNLSKGNVKAVVGGKFIKGDMADTSLLNEIFKNNKIDAVLHFAAFTDVGESWNKPFDYYQNNVCNTLNLLNSMIKNGVKNFIFSSSAAIFGNPKEDIISENHPCHPINPYGTTKLMVEKILDDFDSAYGLKYISLRYFNAAGGDPAEVIKNYKNKENNLIPLLLKNLKTGDKTICVFGDDYPTDDGTCIRDYIHVQDLSDAHILALEKLFDGCRSTCYNLGNGQGFSVKQVISEAAKVTGIEPVVTIGPRRDGDPPILMACSNKAKKELNWVPKFYDLNTIIKHAWQAMKI